MIVLMDLLGKYSLSVINLILINHNSEIPYMPLFG